MDSNETPASGFYDFLAWARLNQKRLLIGGGVVALLVVITAAYIVQANQKEEAASKALSEIPLPASPTGRPDPGTAEKYVLVANEHPSTDGGARALLLAAGTLYAEGKWTDAQTHYERFLREYGESPWAVQALYGRAACLDAGGKAAEAIPKYDELIKRYSSDAVADQARVGLARLYEKQNKNAEALKLYDDVLRTNDVQRAMNYTALESEAGLFRAELLEKHPELVPSNAPPATIQLTPPPPGTNQISRVFTNPPVRMIKRTNADGTVVTNFIRRPTNMPAILMTNSTLLRTSNVPATTIKPAAGATAPKAEATAPPAPAKP
ncbi:MAG TPA: tetratricopeptide repeat protein [Verrucomicrobiae bacterium]